MSSTRLRSRSDRQDRGGPGPLSTGGQTHGTGSEEVDNRINSIVDQENNPAYRSLAMSKAGGSKRTDNSSDNNSEMLNVNCVKQESDVKLPNENNVKMEDSTETVGEDHNIRRGGSSVSPTEHSVQENFPSVAEFDEYGFQIDDDHAEYPRSHNYTKRETGGEDAGKWASLLSDDQWQRNQQSGGKVRSYIQKGVPAGCRGRLWMRLLDIDMLAMNANFSYKANLVAMREQLVEMGICEFKFAESLNVLGNMRDSDFTDKGDHSSMKYIDPVTLRQIFCDIERTYPTHEMFSSRSPRGQEGCATLLRILAVYARYNKQVGYCQGMSYIAGLLLMQMGEVEAFWCLVALFERPKYLQGFYNDSLGKMKNYAAVFKKLLSERLPGLTAHVRSLQLQPMMFLTPWFLGLYTELPCWDTVLAIWDLFLLDGSVTVLRVAMAIMEVFESELMLSCDLSTLLPGLLHLPTHVCNYETLVPVIWGTVIEPWEVNSLLAVVSEEEAIRQQRKRALSEDCVDMAERSKRPRVEASQDSPSIFRRLLNFFTGKSESNTRRLSHSRRMMRRAHHARLARRRPAHLPSHLLSSEDFGGTPGTPTEDTENIRAREEFSFRMFNTPVPVRRSQARQVRLPLMEANSPDVELEAMSLTGFGKSSGSEAP